MEFSAEEVVPLQVTQRLDRRYSLFFLDINTNRRVDKLSPDEIEKFKKIVRYIFSREHILNYLFCTHGVPTAACVPVLHIKFAFQVGQIQLKFHSHIRISVEHLHAKNSSLKVDLKKLRALLFRLYNYNLHVDVAVTNNPMAQIEDYLHH